MAKVGLRSSDDEIFEVDLAVASMFHTIKNMITFMEEYDMLHGTHTTFETSEPVSLPNVSGEILAKVIQFCKDHVDAINFNFEEWANWLRDQQVRDQEYFDVDPDELFDLIPEIKNEIEDARSMPLHGPSKKIREKVREYCDYKMSINEDWKTRADDVKVRDQQFVEVDAKTYVDLVRAGKYLEIKNLLELTRKKYADMITGKTSEEICEMFGVNLTPEEEENPFAVERS